MTTISMLPGVNPSHPIAPSNHFVPSNQHDPSGNVETTFTPKPITPKPDLSIDADEIGVEDLDLIGDLGNDLDDTNSDDTNIDGPSVEELASHDAAPDDFDDLIFIEDPLPELRALSRRALLHDRLLQTWSYLQVLKYAHPTLDIDTHLSDGEWLSMFEVEFGCRPCSWDQEGESEASRQWIGKRIPSSTPALSQFSRLVERTSRHCRAEDAPTRLAGKLRMRRSPNTQSTLRARRL